MKRLKRCPGGEPCIDQGIIHGRLITWNPDDGRFHVLSTDGSGVSAATFKDFRNTVQYARTHQPS